ncbi:B3 domain-containing protein At3g06220-like [Impatiens glandulifera]|uniref:B3 domain-containing protein At3g06220-like n=1 Tax=Impatiens glandulifera TaxID=253017 RepID=UPI001FB1669C|nr:B3 domain-containing protein At3g06220-like [Impatiens glandulifera]XP_047342683.1 B3 domain-containing protein At3g06220-like [Impatiens glandulifera]XP_047342684.1 B3 domain-containing protein At3g06220-like [Impatiens glandulifera]
MGNPSVQLTGQTESFEIDSDEDSNHLKFYKSDINCKVDELIIPENLKDDLMWLAGKRLCIEDVSGGQWEALMGINENGDLCFKKGWINFVKDHSLSKREFLLFIYDGTETFTVRIYDISTGLEKLEFTPPIRSPKIETTKGCPSCPSSMKRKRKTRIPKRKSFVQDPRDIVIID